AHEPRVGAGRDFDSAAPEPRAGRAPTDVSDPGTRAQVIDGHAAGTLPQALDFPVSMPGRGLASTHPVTSQVAIRPASMAASAKYTGEIRPLPAKDIR